MLSGGKEEGYCEQEARVQGSSMGLSAFLAFEMYLFRVSRVGGISPASLISRVNSFAR